MQRWVSTSPSYTPGNSSSQKHRALSRGSQPANAGAGMKIQRCQNPGAAPGLARLSILPPLAGSGGQEGSEGSLMVASFSPFLESFPPQLPVLELLVLSLG